MKVVMATPECGRLIRGSRLGEMTGELSRALHSRGHDITLVHPYYLDVDQSGLPVVDTGVSFDVPVGDRCVEAKLLGIRQSGGVKVAFLANADLFNRPGVYEDEFGPYIDNAERFVFFSRGVLEYCLKMNLQPDVIHCFDWPTGLVPLYMKRQYASGALSQTACVFTIHSMRRQGIFERHQVHLASFDRNRIPSEVLCHFGKLNFLKAGICAADALSALSARLVEEMCSDEFGFGLDDVLQTRRGELFGILNGVNTSAWNPARDRFLKANFGFDEMVGKRSCKADLQAEFELPKNIDVPLLAVLPPLDDNRGMDLLVADLKRILALDVQLVVIGKGQKRIEACFREAVRGHTTRVAYREDDSPLLKHKLLGGADILILPSRYEPSGDDHLVAMRYGTVPLVRATGVLDDAVAPFHPSSGEGTGFKFKQPDQHALLREIRKAVETYRKQRPQWRRLVSNAMRNDSSWGRTASQYEALYRTAAAKRLKSRRDGGGRKRNRKNAAFGDETRRAGAASA